MVAAPLLLLAPTLAALAVVAAGLLGAADHALCIAIIGVLGLVQVIAALLLLRALRQRDAAAAAQLAASVSANCPG